MKNQIIYKYELDPSREIQTLTLPLDSLILSVQMQKALPQSKLVMWVLIDANATATQIRIFKLALTGELLKYTNILHYHGTVQFEHGIVFHILEISPH